MSTRRMSKYDVANHIENVIKEIEALREAGQKEYAHLDEAPFRNFESLADELGTSRERVWWVYFRKHVDGILAYINGHRSQRESVRGRIKDAILYLLIMDAMIVEESVEFQTYKYLD